MKPDTTKSALAPFVLFLAFLLGVWTLHVWLLSRFLNPAEPNAWQEIGNVAVNWLVGVLPVLVIVAREKALEFLRLRSNVVSGFSLVLEQDCFTHLALCYSSLLQVIKRSTLVHSCGSRKSSLPRFRERIFQCTHLAYFRSNSHLHFIQTH
jgi:hypothetical protein